MTLQRAIALLACASLSGCSYAFVHPAPIDHEKRAAFDCTTSRLAPIGDVAAAVELTGTVFVVETISSLTVTGEGESHSLSTEDRFFEVAAIGLAAVSVASAIYGFSNTAKCDDAKGRLQMRLNTPQPRPGCTGDADCKSGRRCVAGACMWPSAPPHLETVAPSSMN